MGRWRRPALWGGTSQKRCQVSYILKQASMQRVASRQKDDVGKDVGHEFGKKQVFVA